MAQPGSPDTQARTLPLSWATTDQDESYRDALQALETYKRKDPSKSALYGHVATMMMMIGLTTIPSGVSHLHSLGHSRRALQGGRQCANHEAELL
jgi:hypothetical protein